MDNPYLRGARALACSFCDTLTTDKETTEMAASVPPDSAAGDDIVYYAPYPLRTFLHDNGQRGHNCSICHETPLRLLLPRDTSTKTDTSPAQLPCGHFFGAKCLQVWLQQTGRRECPVCKYKLQYRDCGHQIRPRVLDLATIALVPKTIPQFGKAAVNSRCPDCSSTGAGQARFERVMLGIVRRIFNGYAHSFTERPNLSGDGIEQEVQGWEQDNMRELKSQLTQYQRLARW